MRRGDVVLAALQREVGKPRPVVVVQGDRINETEPTTYLVCPLTSRTDLGPPELRPVVEPTPVNGLHQRSALMADKLALVGRHKLGDVIGRLEAGTMRQLNGALAVVLGLGEPQDADIPAFLRR